MPQTNTDEIKSKLDVVELVQEYIQLKPAGTNNFKANCPFHHEKSPSFMVSRDKQIWHCFGCGEGGDIFSFVMKMEGMEFPEALRVLAKKAGVALSYQDPTLTSQKTVMQDINRAAAELYHRILLEHPKADRVRSYLRERGVSEASIETWQLGFAPDAYTVLGDRLKGKFKEEDIFQAGLTIKKDRGVGFIDRFRNRLMFPIRDVHANVIGFGGRWLGQEENMAKYINTPQTLIYNKSQVLYGIDQARQSIRTEKVGIVVEGYMDCIASHQAGVTNVVASSGTALTPDQVRLLKRFTTSLAFAFDQDAAGDLASQRGIDVAWQQEMDTKVILIEGAKDPDELIQKDAAAWSKAIADRQSIMDYYFQTTFKKYDAGTVDGKKQAAKVLLPIIGRITDQIEQTHYLQQLGTLLQVDEKILRQKLARQPAPSRGSRPAGSSAAVAGSSAPPADRSTSLATHLLGIILVRPDLLKHLAERLAPELLPEGQIRELYRAVVVYYTKKQYFDFTEFRQSVAESVPALAQYADVLTLQASEEAETLDDEELRREINEGVRQLTERSLRHQLKQLETKLRDAEQRHEAELINQLSEEFASLAARLRQVS